MHAPFYRPATDLVDMTAPDAIAQILDIHRGLFGGYRMDAEDAGNDEPDGAPKDGGRTFTQAELNAHIAEARRKTAAKFADYDALKAKAGEYDQAQDAAKTDLQKALDRALAAEKERDDLRAADQTRKDREALAEQVRGWVDAAAKRTGVPADAIKGSTEAEIDAHAETLKSLLPRKGYVRTEGTPPAGDGNSELRAFAHQLFNKD